MSLIAFHRFLIAAGILFCLGFSGYQLARYADTASGADLLLALIFVTLGLALAYYLSRLAFFLGGGDKSPDG